MLSVEDYIPLMKKELQVIGQTAIDWIYEAKLRGAFDSEFQIGIYITDAINWSGNDTQSNDTQPQLDRKRKNAR